MKILTEKRDLLPASQKGNRVMSYRVDQAKQMDRLNTIWQGG